MNTDKYKGLPAISYARASQGKGRGQELSTDRQAMLTIEYCEKLGLELDLNFRIIDEGVSAFKQIVQIDEYGRETKIAKNLSESALADFVQIVRDGRFPNGVNLIIEKLDRMYRDVPRIALEHFTSLLNNGVTIHTLTDGKIYDPDSKGMEGGMDLFQSVMEMVASHNYSKILSGRMKDSVKLRVKEMQDDPSKFYYISRLPEWVELEKDNGKYVKPFVSEKNKLLVQRIFQMYLEGFSTGDIKLKLNKEGVRNFQGELWSSNIISNLLKSRSVLGIYTPVKGVELFRKELLIVSNSVYHQVQEIMDGRTKKGKKSSDGHIFSGLLCCGYCLHKQKRVTGKPYTNSPLIFRGSGTVNQRYIPKSADKKPVRTYICKSGEVSKRNCSHRRIDYYKLHSSFFSFVKDLDFSSLIDTKTKSQDLEIQSRILELKGDISEIEVKINDQKRLLPLLKNENQLKDIAEEIDNLSFDKDEKIKSLENTSAILEEYNNQKQNFIQSEAELKGLVDKANNDHYSYALLEKLCFYNPLHTNGKKNESVEFTEEQLKEKKDIDRLWNLAPEIINALNGEDKELTTELIAEEKSLKEKYFAKELALDEKGLEFKNRINNELRKFIKCITVYSYGFALGDATKPFDDRKGKSLMDQHKKHLNAFVDTLEGNLDHLKPSRETGWMHKEIMDALNLGVSTYNRYLKSGKLPNLQNTFKSLTPLQTKLKKVKTGAIGSIEDTELSKYFGYSIEFTDLCKPNMVKFVLPFYKDHTQGISFDLNTKTGKTNFDGSFGKKEIKMNKPKGKLPKELQNKYKEQGIFYISDDPIYQKSFQLMFDHISNNYLGSKGLKYGTSMVASNNLPENLTEEQKQDLENRVEQIKKENLEDNN